jgi:hypothetical protein
MPRTPTSISVADQTLTAAPSASINTLIKSASGFLFDSSIVRDKPAGTIFGDGECIGPFPSFFCYPLNIH